MASSPIALPDYTDLNDTLARAKISFQAAQVHGYICGIICATQGEIDNSWLKPILEGKSSSAAKEVLQTLFETSYHFLSEFSFEFSILLPGDDTNINARTEALGCWCQGFLIGLKQCHVPIEHRSPSEITEALNDIVEIAQVNYGDIKTDDAEESAYFELVEYVRLAVLMIFQELRKPEDSPNADNEGNESDENWIH